MSELPYRVERRVAIGAKPETVFRFFTDSARWARWWGEGSEIEARAGGRMYIRYPNGVEARGEVLEVREGERIVFTYGYASGKPIAEGASRVTIRLEAAGGGTQLHLLHEFAEEAAAEAHVQGWRFQLSVFGNLVANEVHADAAERIDAWFGAWSIADERERRAALERMASAGVRFRDRFSLLEGIEDVCAHIGASLRFMPGISMRRAGDVRHCLGSALVAWEAVDGEGRVRMGGTNVFELGSDGRIERVVGFAQQQPPS
jgi:uncharacterized protein YndB with AHSA1/START domain